MLISTAGTSRLMMLAYNGVHTFGHQLHWNDFRRNLARWWELLLA
jgi:hypothetical protein